MQLRLDAVVGVRGFFDDTGLSLQSVGITCALCHSDVDDSLAPGIGRRLDGWAARDLNVGALIALIEGFGFTVDGVNECGRYESRDELLGDRPDGSSEGTGRGSWLRRVLGLFGARRSEG